ncbi:MAG: hypothetical protein AUK54_05515 [Helicobacteraceae bacterium CG2_30_36_10]|nr:MAG: hypothetical protein AUK54_05515 [Helicobacteraceae bacterium CG2_30_36_10]
MTLKYVGPKPIISHTGIEFDNNKEDKFAYLNIVVQLLKAIDHKYFEDKIYTYNADAGRLTSDELLNELKKYCPEVDQLMQRANHHIEEEIEHDIKRARENTILTDEDKIVLEKNINIMHDYLIQRSINKAIYYCAVDALALILREGHVDHIIVPMFQTFFHVLHSIQGSLKRQKMPVESKLEIFQKDTKLLARLQIKNN